MVFRVDDGGPSGGRSGDGGPGVDGWRELNEEVRDMDLSFGVESLQALSVADVPVHTRVISAQITDLLALLAGADAHLVPGADRLALLGDLARHATRIEAIRSDLLAVVDEAGDWRGHGSRTLQEYEKKVSGSSGAQSRQRVSRAKALNEDLSIFKEALAGNEITIEHVDIARKLLATPNMKAKLADPEAGEAHLVQIAKTTDPDVFAKKARAWGIQHTPEAAEKIEQTTQREERLNLVADGEGYTVKGWLTSLNGQIVTTALTAMMGVPSKDDPRGPLERRAAAFTSLCANALDTGTTDTSKRVRPHISVHVPLETLLKAHHRAQQASLIGNHTHTDNEEQVSTSLGSSTECVLETWYTTSMSKPEDAGKAHGRSVRERCPVHGVKGTCLGEVKQRRQQIGDVIATIGAGIASRYFTGLEPATLDDGTALLPSQLQALMCHANLQRIIFDTHGEVLEVGRADRVCTSQQARAVIARDRTCRYPGCHHTIEKSQIHHVQYWSEGGPTDIDNLVMLCWYHHQHIHQRNITITHHTGGWAFTTPTGNLIGLRLHENNPHHHQRETTTISAPTPHQHTNQGRTVSTPGDQTSRGRSVATAGKSSDSRTKDPDQDNASSHSHGIAATGTGPGDDIDSGWDHTDLEATPCVGTNPDPPPLGHTNPTSPHTNARNTSSPHSHEQSSPAEPAYPTRQEALW